MNTQVFDAPKHALGAFLSLLELREEKQTSCMHGALGCGALIHTEVTDKASAYYLLISDRRPSWFPWRKDPSDILLTQTAVTGDHGGDHDKSQCGHL